MQVHFESMKKHRFFHTLVLSSVSIMDGCALSHGNAPLGDAGPSPDAPSEDAPQRADARPSFDAGPVLDVAEPDTMAAADAGVSDAGVMDTGPDVFAVDAGTEHRFCAPGWPPTKGIRVCQVIDEDGVAVLRCAYTFGEDMEPTWEHSDRCNAIIVPREEAWIGNVEDEVPREYVACTAAEEACRMVNEGGRRVLVCAEASCELGEDLLEGTTAR